MFKFRKSVKIAPGVRLNISNKGIKSISLGGKGITQNISKKGARTTFSIPQTGLSYSTTTSFRKKKRTTSNSHQELVWIIITVFIVFIVFKFFV
ncbi:DUF4236 domain-containing protein [Acinetobacter shaoyimingii]|uniref:DUF4236 domain-containing protein n=1 Tax=Acinetobacter shaoyimingii TaxID=2715164 RepID=A0A6G8RXY7_9GAMM|nr:DUF4236 domain-containing protein [Acinetobacter shaoyimingii]NHB57557.1 DUF4236 domain-containing protein [Acinetobacter shaoyimingii]QIO06734.1 DUF4236 domain-containing protein [Acinetobacter shaoyimingii]